MKMRYEYICFVEVERKPKTAVWSCRNNKSGREIGQVRWDAPWRQYCFFLTAASVYSAGCLEDIREFLRAAGDGRAIARRT